jgi:5-methyltetrahydropteroyltriglutamate--homocysteine methyltransferase
MVTAANLGFPRIGLNRELKKALEAYWKGTKSESELLSVAKELRASHWKLQQDAGIELIPTNDFSLYDHILDASCMLGNIPERYNWDGGEIDLDLYFAMARGRQQDGQDVVAMEMTKWFDTNYHYIVPELSTETDFKLSTTRTVDQVKEALALGIAPRPMQIGPVSYLLLGKMRDGSDADRLSLLPKILPVYAELFTELEKAGLEHIQMGEAMLVTDLNDAEKQAFTDAYEYLASKTNLKITIATYFGGLGDNIQTAANLPVAGLHVDLVRAPEQLDEVLNALPDDKLLSIGLVDGRNIWKTNLEAAKELGQRAVQALGADRVLVAPSCSLMHCPIDLDGEDQLNTELKNWLAYAKQKLVEVTLLTDALNGTINEHAFAENKSAIESRKNSLLVHNAKVQSRMTALTVADAKRISPFEARIKAQKTALDLPLLPTTTIGSFPQTQEIRQMRSKFKKGNISEEEYDAFLAKITEELIAWQDEIGIDVPVHGEYERNDMVEYFGEQLEGYAFSKNGWVQSYGSRCVKPPVIYGDVSRPEAMTVRWSAYAQSLTKSPVKGMLTGPITMLQWAFVRDDQPRSETCKQIALAIRDEVKDLETAGVTVIQIDEPAFREGLPLRDSERSSYLDWAVEAFRISSSGIEDTTQIHTHMCYSEFNDIINSIADLDADVISIETSRSAMELLDAFVEFKYPNEIGPGVYDIHSPRIPKTAEMEKLLYKALDVLDKGQVWVNPDCGLKTRNWDEVKPALANMVEATKNVRSELEWRKHNVKKEAADA